MRRRRRWIASWLMLGFVFAQMVTAVHACPTLTTAAAAPAQAATPDSPTNAGDCASMAKQAGASVKVCESHCAAGNQVGTHAEAPAAALAPHPALTVRAILPAVPVAVAASTLSAVSAAPPPLILFTRFLI